MEEEAEFSGELPLQFEELLAGAVGREVVADDDLVVEGRHLRQRAPHGLLDIGRVVVGDHRHAHLRHRADLGRLHDHEGNVARRRRTSGAWADA